MSVIGWAGPKRLRDRGGEIDVGFWLMPAHWGQGLGTEAARCVVQACFESFDFDELVAYVDEANHSSIGVLRKVGFVEDGVVDYHGDPALRFVLRRTPRE